MNKEELIRELDVTKSKCSGCGEYIDVDKIRSTTDWAGRPIKICESSHVQCILKYLAKDPETIQPWPGDGDVSKNHE